MSHSVHTSIVVGQRPPAPSVDGRGRSTSATASPRAGARSLGFRPDIEGLRAVAVVLVVLNHVGIGLFAGGYVGVDVFFVISGFLITTLLLKEAGRTGTISLRRFYARRAIRLLPVSTVVLIATVLAAWFWLPATRFRSISLDALFSTFYGINWRLAYEGTDYLNATAAPSPLQHLWSLAVEEQFYLVWPLLLILVWKGRKAAFTLGALVLISLLVSVQQTAAAAPWAYFGSHTRAWELGIGALVALSGGFLGRTPKALAAVMTWGGLLAVVAAAVTFDKTTPFPGYAALLPVLGTAAVIAGGSVQQTRLIGTRPFQFVGRLSYGWYLWHWPVLMIWPAALGREPGVKSNLAFATASLVLAWITYHLIENPVRHRRRLRNRARRGLILGIALSASAAAVALVAGMIPPTLPVGPPAPDTRTELVAAPDPQARLTELITGSLGAARMPSNLTPALAEAKVAKPAIYDDGCHATYQQVRSGECVHGDPAGARTMFLVGDSHAAHWFPAVDDLAKAHGWRLVALTKAACQMPRVLIYLSGFQRPYRECTTWREQTLRRIVREKPDLVVLASNDLDGGLLDDDGRRLPRADPPWVRAWQQTWERLDGIPTVLLQDTPWPGRDAPECAAVNARQLTRCDRTVGKAIAERKRRTLVAAAARKDGLRVIDPTPWFCAAGRCPIIVGNTLVYKDNSHLTDAYVRAIAPLLGRELFSGAAGGG